MKVTVYTLSKPRNGIKVIKISIIFIHKALYDDTKSRHLQINDDFVKLKLKFKTDK